MEPHKPRNQLEKALRDKLDNRYVNSTLRKLTAAPEHSVDFSSNDFLSLSTSSTLRSAFLEELTRQGDFQLGSGGSRLLDGNSKYAVELENEIAAFHNAQSGILFNSGFDANSGLFACIPQPGDVIVHDELIHASVHDGMKMSRAAQKLPFAHNCMIHLREVLESLKSDIMISKGPKNVFIAVESVYSMDGDIAPLAEIVSLIDDVLPYGNGHIVVDEAHATGVLGPKGRGLVCKLGLEDRMFARLHTFGKSLAASGAIVLCSPLVRSYLINYARPLIYTTFMPFPSLAAIKASYSLLQSGATEPLVDHLIYITQRLHTQLLQLLSRNHQRTHVSMKEILQIDASCPASPIFALLTHHPRSLAQHCQDDGFIVRAVVPPTVPTRRVRVCLHAGNTVEEVDRLVQRIEVWVREQIGVDSPRDGGLEVIKARL
ncbi:PLP-dependent transferase [Tothia fuscella]|uniref:PLP-dependent transferase n=1 Tax=Tothia fuscella TaxID=1048955 RepID=A0A9P4NN61_9PEZI|nr:PLP-dependent transferase [Tothia fuscella]